ncbi:unnamed protein product [Brassica rapa subsp. trilocularis]
MSEEDQKSHISRQKKKYLELKDTERSISSEYVSCHPMSYAVKCLWINDREKISYSIPSTSCSKDKSSIFLTFLKLYAII